MSATPFTRPPLAALVYRVGKGCRQYAFETVEELAAWAARPPYKNEQLRVLVATDDGKLAPEKLLPAREAAEYVRQQRHTSTTA